MRVSELKETSERLQSQYKTEKQKRKETELKLNGLEEELQDVKTDKDSLERVRSFLTLEREKSKPDWMFMGSGVFVLDVLREEEEVAGGETTMRWGTGRGEAGGTTGDGRPEEPVA